MVQRPDQLNRFVFAVLAGRRASQLSRGCLPRVSGSEKVAVTAQMEVAEGKVVRAPAVVVAGPGAAGSPDTVKVDGAGGVTRTPDTTTVEV